MSAKRLADRWREFSITRNDYGRPAERRAGRQEEMSG
jgi:hypothetical protein